MKRLTFLVAVLVLGLAGWAQQPPPVGTAAEDPADAAEHGVARVGFVEGNVSVARGDSGEAVSNALNSPLVTADRIFTGEGSRAEVQFDSANLIRLAPNTELRMGDLAYRSYLIQIARGSVMFRVLRDNDSKIELSTPNVSVAPLRQGTYRVTVRPDGTTEVTVRAGEANILAAGGSERLPAGQTMLARGSSSDPEFMTNAAIGFDDWDRWNTDRDRYFERYDDRNNDTARYTGPDMSGTEDLAANGHWVNDPAYGSVWVPNNVPPDWAPYRDGRWDYLDYYGWSWVSYDPWGWAPYHYGNWYRARFGWAWYPGPIGPRHYWRPAMVGFFGFGSPGFGTTGIGLSLGFGYSHVGWVPLAPFEPYRPWYGRGYAGRSGVIAGNMNIAGAYRNARFTDAVTGMRAGDFGRANIGRTSFVRPAASELGRAGVVNGGVPFAPARNSFASRGNAVVPLNGRSNSEGRSNFGVQNGGGFQNGGWRRLDSSGTRPQNSGSNGGGFRSFTQGSQAGGQPVRISPPIVNNRNQAAPNFGNGYSGFGGARNNSGTRPNNGFGNAAPTQQRSAPAPGPGRSAPQGAGGGFHGGGNGGGGFRGGGHGGGAHR
jgi:hypothetical protein